MHRTLLILLIAVLALLSSANAVFWSSNLDTNSTHWSIYRESSNFSFSLTGLVEGKISPVEARGRILHPYQAHYAELGSNEVLLRTRTNSKEGSYKSIDELTMESTVNPDQIDIFVDKTVGSDIYTIEYKNEKWPVFLKSKRIIDYTGSQINDRDFQANNGDYASSNFLYNRDLFKDKLSVMWLQRLNATVLATNDSILLAEFEATKYLGDQIIANTTGIADISYGLRDFRYDVKHNTYPYGIIGEERYYGDYNISRKIEMRSMFARNNNTEDDDYSWLPCCDSGWNDIIVDCSRLDGFGTSEKEIFDCACFRKNHGG
jgi:hypothetical protein